MTAPTAPIDASLSPANGIYWALEPSSVWKTENLGGGAATWVEAYTAAAFEAANDCTDCQFMRVVSPSDDLIYVLAYALKNGESDGSTWVLVSNNKGTTWNAYTVEDGITNRDYTVTYRYGVVTQDGGKTYLDLHHGRVGDAGAGDYNPWALAHYTTVDPAAGVWSDFDEDSNSINGFGGSSYVYDQMVGMANALLSGPDEDIAKGWITEYLGAFLDKTSANTDMPKETNRVNVRVGTDHADGYSAYWKTWVFWNVPSPIMPKCIAVAPTNNNWLYVGLNDKIRASEDGGVTWFDFYIGHGAFDICVDPQLAGAIYYWSSDGNLNLLMKQTLGAAGVLTSEGLMTETPLDIFGRVERDPSSGILLGIPNGTVLTRRINGANENIGTGYTNARGLHAYPGQKIIFVDGADVHISNDIQAGTPTITAKKGGWATYGNGVQAHRMVGS